MPHELDPIHPHRASIARELFVDTADDNYIAARWCFAEGLNVDWFWLAVHTLEKYMKAAILLNGRSAKGYGHDIDALYAQTRSFAGDLLPDTLTRPDTLDTAYWRDEAADAFIRRFQDNGNADNRYQIYGFVQHHEDLFKLDSMVFALRRLCVPLDAYYLGRHRPGSGNPAHRDILTNQPEHWRIFPGCKLTRTSDGKRGEGLRDVLLNLNIPFAPDGFCHQPMRSRTASHNPVLLRSILKPLQKTPGDPARVRAEELRDWVLDNVQLPKNVVNQLRQATAQPAP